MPSFRHEKHVLCKRGHSDIEIGTIFSSSRMREPTKQDLGKLRRDMNSLVATIDDITELDTDNSGNLCWRIDVCFTIHEEIMRRHDE